MSAARFVCLKDRGKLLYCLDDVKGKMITKSLIHVNKEQKK